MFNYNTNRNINEDKIMCEHELNHEEENENGIVIRITIATLIFIAAILLHPTGLSRFFIYMSAYLIVGVDIVLRAIKNIFKGEIFDENFLMAIATVGAICIGEYPEAVMVMLLYQIGEKLQDNAVEKSKQSSSTGGASVITPSRDCNDRICRSNHFDHGIFHIALPTFHLFFF